MSDDPDEGDWEDFFATYRLTILAYAQRKGLNRSEADDVLQETMMSLMKAFESGFVYDRNKGRFRGFLHQKVRWRIADAIRRKGKCQIVFTENPEVLYRDEGSPDEDKDWQFALVTQALLNLREQGRFSEKNMHAFESVAMKGFSAKEVAQRQGMEANNVHQICHRIRQALQEEIALLRRVDR